MKTGSWIFLIVLIALAAAVYYAFNTPALKDVFTPKNAFLDAFAKKQLEFEAENGQDFLLYTHPDKGYSIKYPVGYLASSEPEIDEPDVSLRIWADSPISSAEVFTVRLQDEGFTDKDFEETLATFDKTSVVSSYSGTLDGRKTFLFTVKHASELTNETFFVRTAIYPDCKAKDGTTYSAMIMAAIPSVLSADLDAADYMIYSFKC